MNVMQVQGKAKDWTGNHSTIKQKIKDNNRVKAKTHHDTPNRKKQQWARIPQSRY